MQWKMADLPLEADCMNLALFKRWWYREQVFEVLISTLLLVELFWEVELKLQ